MDHTRIGRRYIATAFIFLAMGAALALVMRLQLAGPERRLIGPDLYNQIFTMHGANILFLFAASVMEAMAVYLVPLMISTRNIAFPAAVRILLLDLSCRWRASLGAFAVDRGPDVG